MFPHPEVIITIGSLDIESRPSWNRKLTQFRKGLLHVQGLLIALAILRLGWSVASWCHWPFDS